MSLLCVASNSAISDFFFGPLSGQSPEVWDTSQYLVGGLEHFLFLHILGIIIPTD